MFADKGEVKFGFSLNRWVPIAFEAVILILLVVGTSAYRAMLTSSESDRWVSHTHEVLEDLGELERSLESIESSYRGFVLTGQEAYLRSYAASILEVQRREAALLELTLDNPRQKPRLLALEKVARQQTQFAQMVIGLRRSQGMATAADAIRNGEGEQLQDELKAVIRETRDEEQALLVRRIADAKKHLGHAKFVVILGILLALLLDVAAVWSVKREIRARGVAEKGLLAGEERFREAERSAAESKLRESEASFHHFLADAMPQIVFTTDAKGGLDYYNQRRYDYTGMTFEQTKDWGWQPVIHPDDLENCMMLWTGALKACEPMQVLYRFRRASDNTYRWHLGQSRPIRNDQGVVVRWFGTATDIEDFKQAEMQIRILNGNLEERVRERTAELDRANVRLEQSNRELQDFASVASHDLQEPLRKVQAFGDRLRTGCGDTLDEKGRDSLDRMLGASKRMQSLIQDLLSFARVTSQARPFLPVDLAQIAREVLSDLEIRIAENRAVVELGDLPVIVADGSQMRQLLQNLIGNALKFHRPGSPPVVRVYTETADATLRLVIEDDGIGFDEKYLDRIFTVFQRLHGRSQYEGTGIGLAICRKIAQRHGGDITATSAPGKGAKFVVSLPCPRIPDTQADMSLGILKLVNRRI